MKYTILFFSIFILSTSAYSQEEDQNFVQRWWNAAKNDVTNIYDIGTNDLYVSGYAYHDRSTYTKEKLKDLNEGAYGGGLGRSIYNEKGNTEILYEMIHLDSHKKIQAEAGYAWLKNFNPFGNFKLGIGFASGIVRRTDIAGGVPIPFALPMAAIDFGKISINAILVPKLNDGINNGNVVFFFAKIPFDRIKG